VLDALPGCPPEMPALHHAANSDLYRDTLSAEKQTAKFLLAAPSNESNQKVLQEQQTLQ